jgi:hypothetical protein
MKIQYIKKKAKNKKSAIESINVALVLCLCISTMRYLPVWTKVADERSGYLRDAETGVARQDRTESFTLTVSNFVVTFHSFIHSFTGAYSPRRTFGLPFRGFLITHIQTHGRTPLEEWSARHRGLYLHRTTQHINTTDKHPGPERDSNPRSHQPSGRRPTP